MIQFYNDVAVFLGLCILLRRMAYPNRLQDIEAIFGRRKQDLSVIFNTVLDFIYRNFKHLLSSFDQWWLKVPYLKRYAEAIARKGAPLRSCFGFIDGNCFNSISTTSLIIRIVRPWFSLQALSIALVVLLVTKSPATADINEPTAYDISQLLLRMG